MAKWMSLGVVALALVACGGSRRTVGEDAGSTGNDAGSITTVDSGTVTQPDAARVDSGGSTGDACSSEEPLSTLGCNGGFQGTPTPNGPAGACTGGGEASPSGTCTGGALCSGEEGASGFCFPTCTPTAATYVSTGGCPAGFRCFDLEGGGLCFRDCDASHACPTGMTCDEEGSCVP